VNTVLLQGIVGSTAYGLAGPHSDVDRLGVYAAPTKAFHGLRLPIDRAASVVVHEPEDLTLHEARKFALLALSANPTVTELLWLPDPQRYHDFGHAVAADPTLARETLDAARYRFSTIESALPDRPDEATVEAWLLRVRDVHLEK
jgi:predicted nucleotidyltransferase